MSTHTSRPDPRHEQHRTWSPGIGLYSLGAIGVVAAAAAVVVGTNGSGATADADAAGDDVSAAVAHVHGLGVDPLDGALYAGTHYGLVQLPADGYPRRVADLEQDFMGFTVAGPGHYLASGHPAGGEGGPSSLGLIESVDGGRTWTSLSLGGEADFHALEARHGLVYGHNSLTGELMVSPDKLAWEARSTIALADLAVSPADPETVLATTQQGVVRSVDGGRVFDPLPAAPLLQLITWAEDGTLVGLSPSGAVHVSQDGGQAWEQRGDLQRTPQAVTATSVDQIYVAVSEGAILLSEDGGRTFTEQPAN